MIKAANHSVWEKFFNLYILWNTKKRFRKVNFIGEWADNGKPILVIANHFSWWDGFLVRYLSQMVFKRRFHVMMREDQLLSRKFLSKLGAFSVKKGNRSVAESLQYAASLFASPQNMLLWFPQGRFYSQHARDILFEPGIFRLMERIGQPYSLCFVAILIDYFEFSKPTVSIYYEFQDNTDFVDVNAIEKAYNSFYRTCVISQEK